MAKEITWLEYEWQLDGDPALFGVELSLYRTAPDAENPVLCYFCFEAEGSDTLSDSDIKRIESLAAKCVQKCCRQTAGFIQSGNTRQYYFYVSSKEQYDVLKTIADKEKRFVCKVAGRREPEWTTYFKLLYPDEAKYQTVRNGEVIAKYRDNGDNLEAARRINMHVYFRTEQQRILFEEAARQAGFAIGTPDERVEQELPYGATLHRVSTLQKPEIDEMTIRAIRIAGRWSGRLVYWDCAIVPKNITKR